MKQYEAVVQIMEENGGYATLKYLNDNVLKVRDIKWGTKTPYASIRRIVQDSRFFFKIKPGLWALKSYKNKLPSNVLRIIEESKTPIEKEQKFTHYYYQGIIAEIGILHNYKTFIPPQDRNKPFLNKQLRDVSNIECLPLFTYPNIINSIKSIDVIWINERNFPDSVFEIEHSTDFRNSLNKFYELMDFNTQMFIVSDNQRKSQFDSVLKFSIYSKLKDRVKFCDYETIGVYYSNPYQIKNLFHK